MSAKPKPISGLARRLIQDGLIELEAAEKYSLEAAKARRPLVSYLVKENIVSAEAIAAAAASEFGTAIIMAFLGIVVGGMMIAMYLPIFQMGGAISG